MSKRVRKRSNARLQFLMFVVGVGLILAGALWRSQIGSRGSSGEANTNPAAIPLPGIARVSLEEARAAYERGEAVFVDVRNAETYAESHIPGAILIPEPEVGQRLGELDPEKWVITY